MTWLIAAVLIILVLSWMDWVFSIILVTLALSLILPGPDSWVRETIPSLALTALALYFIYHIARTLYFGLSNSGNNTGSGAGSYNSIAGEMGGDSGGDGGGGLGGGDGGDGGGG